MKLKRISILILVVLLFAILGTIYLLWANDDSSYTKINSISTLLLTIFTFVYVFLTFLLLKANHDMTLEQTRPFIQVSFPTEGTEVFFSIKNIGLRPAYNVRIKINPDVESSLHLK